MIVLHHLENSRSQRVLWLLEELGLPYEIRHYRRDPQTLLAPPELRAVHALGKSPVITDGEVTVAESGAIVEYLLDAYGDGRLRPTAGTPERRAFTYWLHFAEGSAMPPLLLKLVFDRIRKARLPFFAKPVARRIADRVGSTFITPTLEAQLRFMEGELTKARWFAGAEFSAADVQMSFVLEAAAARGGLDARFPHLQDWLARIHARPAYQRAIDKGGPFTVAS